MSHNTMLKYLILLLFISTLLLFTQTAIAQQNLVDDAAITSERSFQIETWYGSEEALFIPAVGVNPWLEISSGLVFNSSNNMALANFFLESKMVQGDIEGEGQAYGLVAGMMLDDKFSFDGFYAYVPYSRQMLNESSVLHLNLGTSLSNHPSGTEFGIFYGAGAEFGVHERFSLYAEVFAEGTDFAFQGGVSFSLIPDLLQMDVTYGQGFKTGQNFPGFGIGVAYTPNYSW